MFTVIYSVLLELSICFMLVTSAQRIYDTVTSGD